MLTAVGGFCLGTSYATGDEFAMIYGVVCALAGLTLMVLGKDMTNV